MTNRLFLPLFLHKHNLLQPSTGPDPSKTAHSRPPLGPIHPHDRRRLDGFLDDAMSRGWGIVLQSMRLQIIVARSSKCGYSESYQKSYLREIPFMLEELSSYTIGLPARSHWLTWGEISKHLEDGRYMYELSFGGFFISIRTSAMGSCLSSCGKSLSWERNVVEVVYDHTGVAENVTMNGDDVGTFEVCNKIVQLVLTKDASVHSNPSIMKSKLNYFL